MEVGPWFYEARDRWPICTRCLDPAPDYDAYLMNDGLLFKLSLVCIAVVAIGLTYILLSPA